MKTRSAPSGTPAYMAAEQISKGEASVRSDIYSLGLVFHELFTGRLPYQATTPVEWRRAHLESSPRAPSSVVKDIDPVVETAILLFAERSRIAAVFGAPGSVRVSGRRPVGRGAGGRGDAVTRDGRCIGLD
jgi:serine/threonine protein kinase